MTKDERGAPFIFSPSPYLTEGVSDSLLALSIVVQAAVSVESSD
jgi:hypothetical protein